MKHLSWAIVELGILGSLVFLAVHFNRWWIILFALVIFFSVAEKHD